LGAGWSAELVQQVAGSPPQFCEYTGADNAQAETIEEIVTNWEHRHAGTRSERYARGVVALAKARQALASIARGKLTAGLAMVSPDGRLRDMHRYYGAHTGRWSGRGIQLHNMPRPDKRFEAWHDGEICHLADVVLAGKHHADQDEIDLLLRACLVAKPGHTFAVCDFSGVEARALAWVAGDGHALSVFADPKRDPYKEMAAVIFGVPASEIGKDERRQVGKIAELACGYGMGGPKFGATAAKAGSNLDAMGIDPAEVVRAWRELHDPIVRFWRELECAFAEAVKGSSASAGTGASFELVPSDDGEDVALFLPSGRPIVYSETRIGRNDFGRPALAFRGTKNVPEHTYGGKLTENAIQALCRDLMADSLVKSEAEGLSPVLHVHDEIVCEVPANAGAEAYDVLRAIMLDVPAWAEGFPMGAAGHVGKRYRK
jgi:DNA polymerase